MAIKDLFIAARQKGLRQTDIAKALGVSEGTISKWANGEAHVPPRMIRPLAGVLEVSVDALVPTVADPQPRSAAA
jgi:transcriptional regulator with XRE-family HTH domain